MERINHYCKYSGKLTLKNDFHNTEAVVIVKDGIISEGSLKRAEKKLCGMKECACGDIRGIQDMIIEICYDSDGRYAKVFEK